jgi:hypothetical protein
MPSTNLTPRFSGFCSVARVPSPGINLNGGGSDFSEWRSAVVAARIFLATLIVFFTLTNAGYSQSELALTADDVDEDLLGLSRMRNAIFSSTPAFEPKSVGHRLLEDQTNFYSSETLVPLGIGLAVGGVLANSNSDTTIQDHLRSSILRADSDEWFEVLHANKEWGNGIYTLPLMAGAWVGGELFPDSPHWQTFGEWGERSLRTFAVGAPPMYLAQYLTGGSRPGETDHKSHWRPFNDNNGVSGHSFMSSLLFINAAKMTDRPAQKFGWYALSTLGPLSRLNDDAHYPSQTALGWWFAYLAASAVDNTQRSDRKFQMFVYPSGDGFGIQWSRRF